jgi:hypothetical protein
LSWIEPWFYDKTLYDPFEYLMTSITRSGSFQQASLPHVGWTGLEGKHYQRLCDQQQFSYAGGILGGLSNY